MSVYRSINLTKLEVLAVLGAFLLMAFVFWTTANDHIKANDVERKTFDYRYSGFLLALRKVFPKAKSELGNRSQFWTAKIENNISEKIGEWSISATEVSSKPMHFSGYKISLSAKIGSSQFYKESPRVELITYDFAHSELQRLKSAIEDDAKFLKVVLAKNIK